MLSLLLTLARLCIFQVNVTDVKTSQPSTSFSSVVSRANYFLVLPFWVLSRGCHGLPIAMAVISVAARRYFRQVPPSPYTREKAQEEEEEEEKEEEAKNR